MIDSNINRCHVCNSYNISIDISNDSIICNDCGYNGKDRNKISLQDYIVKQFPNQSNLDNDLYDFRYVDKDDL